MTEGTLTVERPGAGGPDSAEQLLLLLRCDAPAEPSRRYLLSGLHQLTIGRGDATAASRQRQGARELLDVRVADRWMSGAHAILARAGGRWRLADAGSHNGCWVNGVQKDEAELCDGDLLELGTTFWLYREGPAEDLERAEPHPFLTTLSGALASEYARVARIAPSDVAVLIGGETGTGKERLARAIHELSGRKGAFVAVNCGALVLTLGQSELFGHRRGAFSGADEDRPGLVRSADGGTLFLDEVGDLPAAAQTMLLRVLQEREVQPVGETRPQRVDLRVVAATHRDLRELCETGVFREDLLARLGGYEARLPPLRERREDLGALIGTLLAQRSAGDPPALELAAARALLAHAWPRNVRELEQALKSAAALAAGGPIAIDHLPPAVRSSEPQKPDAQRAEVAQPVTDPVEAAIRDRLLEALRDHGGNVAAAARALGRDRKQVHRWAKRFGIDLDAFRPD